MPSLFHVHLIRTYHYRLGNAVKPACQNQHFWAGYFGVVTSKGNILKQTEQEVKEAPIRFNSSPYGCFLAIHNPRHFPPTGRGDFYENR